MRTHASWRDLPPEFGKWETAYQRYRLWGDLGIWPRLFALLGDAPSTRPPKCRWRVDLPTHFRSVTPALGEPVPR